MEAMKHKPDEVNMTQRQTQVKITPEMAKGFLAKSNGNRAIRTKTKLLAYKKDMERGAWQYNGDAIRFTYDGVLVDGHHRLTACVETGCSFEADIVLIPSSSVHTMDKGATRSEADSLVMEYGYEKGRANAIVTAVTSIIQHDAGASSWPNAGGALQHRVTHHVVAGWVDENKEKINASVEFAFSFEKAYRLITQGHICALHFLGSRAYGSDVTEAFLTKVMTGHYIEPGTTAEHIRTTLLMSRSGQVKMAAKDKVMTVAKGLRSVAAGRNISYRSNAVFKSGSDNPVFLK